MAGTFGDDINNRSDFFEQLALARREAAGLLQRLPDEDTLWSVAKQLDAIAGWTAEGRTPTLQKRKSINMGHQMFREYEMTDDVQIYKLRGMVSGIDSYVKFWPDDVTAADPNNVNYLLFSRL